MRFQSNVNVSGVPARDLVESLRPFYSGRAMVRGSELRDKLTELYSRQGKDFTEEHIRRLFAKAGCDPQLMQESNAYVEVYDAVELHILFCMDEHCAKCHPDNPRDPELDPKADPEFIARMRKEEEEVYNFDPSDQDTAIVDPAKELAEGREREELAAEADLERVEIQMQTMNEV